MSKKKSYPLLALAAMVPLLVACGANAPVPDPFENLPPPVAGVPAQGNYVSTASPIITVNGIDLPGTTLQATASLSEGADGTVSGYVTVTGIDGIEYPILISGTNDDGRLTVPVNVFLCNEEMTLTLYGTVAQDGTVSVAGDARDLDCYGQSVSIEVPQFTVSDGGAR